MVKKNMCSLKNDANRHVLKELANNDSWRMFKIIGEFAEGFDMMRALPASVSIFGSARTQKTDPLYSEVEKLSYLLGKNGYGIITGGGLGLMEAANKGAMEAGAISAGLHIQLPMEQAANEYLTHRCDFRYFFVRKVMFVKHASAYVVCPGGAGTLDEFFESFVLMQTDRVTTVPIILYKKKYWEGLLAWMRSVMVDGGFINSAELNTLHIVDTPEEVVHIVAQHVPLDK